MSIRKLLGSIKLGKRAAAGKITADCYVVGLGNRGEKYAHTRHNAGFDVVKILSGRHGITMDRPLNKALTGTGAIAGLRVMLIQPQTLMNRSGESMIAFVKTTNMCKENMIVVYDDIDLPPGKVRIRNKGGAGTHNGMRSVIFHLAGDRFTRVRIGIGRPEGSQPLSEFVLNGYSDTESAFKTLNKAADAVEEIIKNGIAEAQKRFN